jgi:enoyl-CoA hydratase
MDTLMSFETILVERRGAVTVVTLNRPQALNALNSQVQAELVEAFAAYDADETQLCLLLTGSEKAFAAGADIKEMSDKSAAEMRADGGMFSGYAKITATKKPWFAAVSGYALGGGCELAMMADFILAADTAKFGQPEITLGISPGMGGTQRLARAVGKPLAMEMCLTGRMLDAAEALSAGMVARVIPAAELMDEAVKTAEKIASMPPLAAKAVKAQVDATQELSLAEGIALEADLFAALFDTQDQKEGMAAFTEKRAPKWTGK